MKKSFLKLLMISGLCLSTLGTIIPQNNVPLAISVNNISNISSGLDIKFFIHEGDILISRVILNNDIKNNVVSATISDKSLTIDIVDGQVEIYGLKPTTKYTNLIINLTDSSNNTHSYKIKDFKTPDYNFIGYGDVKLNLVNDNYVANVSLPVNPSMPINGIKSVESSDSSINAEIHNNSITLKNLKNNHTYNNLTLKITTTDNKIYVSEINTFSIPDKALKSVDVKVSSYKNNYSGLVELPSDINPVSAEISDNNILIDVANGEINLIQLKENTKYSNLTLRVIDNNGNEYTFKVNDFSTENKNYGYADMKVESVGNNIHGTLILPDDLIIKNAKFSDTSLKFSVDTNSNKLIITNLSPNTTYNNLKTIVQDTDGKLHNFIINKFFTGIVNVDVNKLAEYIENAYVKAFDREKIDKDGFNYWFEQLSNHKLSSKHFILNILNTNEFLNIAKNSKDKITRIYGVMYNRTPDEEGLKFWIDQYETELNTTNNEQSAVLSVVKKMIEEEEFKNIVSSMGIKY